LRNLLHRPSRSRQRQGRLGRGSRRATFQPAVEGLEDRQLLSTAALFAPSATLGDRVWYSTGNNMLCQHHTNPSATLSIALPSPIVQVSAGTTAWNTTTEDAAFVLDNQHNVWEVIDTWNALTAVHIATNVQEISGSIVSGGVYGAPKADFDTVFAISSLDHSVSRYQNTPFSGVVHTPLGLPSSGGPFQATHLSAGRDGTTGQAAVFVNFDGAVYEHTGLTANAGWSYVAGINLLTWPKGQPAFAATWDFSASQRQGDTVFVINALGCLFEDVGHSNGANTPLSYTSHTIAIGVTQVSAGMDQSGNAAAFALSTTGSLDEYTAFGATKSHIANSVTSLSAVQNGTNSVCYLVGSFQTAGSQLLEYDGMWQETITDWQW
jgi:hypothetical protein